MQKGGLRMRGDGREVRKRVEGLRKKERKSDGKEKDVQGDAIGGLRLQDKKGRCVIITEIRLNDKNKEKRDEEKMRERPLKTLVGASL